MSRRLLFTIAIAASLVISVRSGSATAARIPGSVLRYLSGGGFGPDEYAALTAGRPASRLLEVTRKDQVAVMAAVRIDVPPAKFLAAYRDIASFESGTEVQGIGAFSEPPDITDLATLTLPDSDLDSLRSCRIGDCEINLSSDAIEQFRREVHWSSATAAAEARHVLQKMLLAQITGYQRKGNEALVVYRDRASPISVRESSNQLFADSDTLASVPGVADYFQHYHDRPLPEGAEEFFYWQQVTFGMKPVTRINHVVIAPFSVAGHAAWAIVSRMIYASHYFRDGLEIRYVMPTDASAAPPAFYLVLINRSHSEALTGIKGLVLGSAIRRKARDSSARHLGFVKQRIEAQVKATSTP
jgi:hypothetical protein